MKKKIFINNQPVSFDKEKNVLDVVRRAGIELPTFCYHSELSIYGACRMCVVENDRGQILTSCSTPPKDGMKIFTNTPRLQKYRRMILELLLSNHCGDCTICEKNGTCKLQELALKLGLKKIRFEKPEAKFEIDDSSISLVRNPNKCIICGDCVRMCEEIQGIGVLGFAYRGAQIKVTPSFDRKLAEVACVNCGQCASVCPTGAIVIKSHVDEAWEAINQPDTRVVVQIAPAVRVALGEEFGLPPGEIVTGKIAAALKKLGVDEVYDTSVGADLTVIEETKEFLDKFLNHPDSLPLFTSCCPAWVRLVEQKFPELQENVSTCRSPQQMFGAVIKEHYKKRDAAENKKTIMISIMPCTAKKYEANREEYRNNGVKDVDIVLTTQELARMFKEAGIAFEELEPESLDMPFGLASGAGVIFGASGGVAEAVIRRCSTEKISNSNPIHEIFQPAQGLDNVKEACITVDDKKVHIAVVNGLSSVQKLIKQIKSRERKYDFIEVMACPGGCIGGAGQPVSMNGDMKYSRTKGIYKADSISQIKKSEENPVIISLYNGILSKNRHILHHPKTKKSLGE
jgi:NADH-quinone oxidoreductase subunit G